jgi:hypothetical protein
MPISRVRRATATAMSAYRPAAEKTSAPSRMMPKTAVPTIMGVCRCAMISSSVITSRSCKPGIDLPHEGGHARRERRGVARDTHGDDDGIELRHGHRAVHVLRLAAVGGIHAHVADDADDLVPRPRLAVATARRQRAHARTDGVGADFAHERFVDEHRPVRRAGVARVQRTAGDELAPNASW